MVSSALRSEKGGANMLRALSLFKKYKTVIYDISGIRRYSQNILQWRKIKTKKQIPPNGDYYSILIELIIR